MPKQLVSSAALLVCLILRAHGALAQRLPSVLTSPNGKIEVTLTVQPAAQNHLVYSVRYLHDKKTTLAVPASRLGLIRDDEDFAANLKFLKITQTSRIAEQYELVHGKRKRCRNAGVEKVFRFANPHGKLIDIAFRAYDNGVAFRYSFPEASTKPCALTQEATEFNIPATSGRWMQPYTTAYEDFYNFTSTGEDVKKKQEFGFPALVSVASGACYALLSEANVLPQHCATHLANKQARDSYRIVMPQPQLSLALPWQSQWRVIALGQLSDIVETTLVTDVSEPSKVADTRWIKPGSCAWIYWAYNHGSKDYQTVKQYVDLGAAMGWPYVLIDWEWDVMANGGTITDAIAYAKQKGLKPILWYNSGDKSNGAPGPWSKFTTPQAREKEFTWLNEMGVAGIKVDFFDGDEQKVIKYYFDLMADAAKHQLLVNFHGATVPKGWSRTYPNLMSTEAVYGAEWYNNGPQLTDAAARHNTTLPFTRNVVGPMDYTPVTFSNSQHPHITSYAHELALSVVFESGLQHFADRPEAYNALPEAPKNFLKTVPAAWDDTKLVDGYPGEKVVIARQKDGVWYVGGLNGKNDPQSLTVKLVFLGNQAYSLELLKDGADDKSFGQENRVVKAGESLRIDCLPRGGFVAVLKPVSKSN
jgi:hypothetical protein